MRRLGMFAGAALLVTSSLIMGAGAASASNGMVAYQGTFSGSIQYAGCTTTPATAGGTWAVTVHGNSATAVFDITVNGQPHVAYTYPGMKQAYVSGTTFVVVGITQAGPLTVTLYPNGSFTYIIAPYSYDSLSCASVTYPGTETD